MTWPFRDEITPARIADAAAIYAATIPFPHIVLDGWFDRAALLEVSDLFESVTAWQQYEDGKRATSAVKTHPFFEALNGPEIRAVIEQIAGEPLVVDPTMRGGGLHAVERGGRLGIHVDFNRHPALPLERAVNTILYLNPIWADEWGGALTLTDRKDCTRRIAPRWNRWVIFKYGPESWHGHPDPLVCPEGFERRSAAVYYYRPLTGALSFTGTQYA